MEPLRKTKRTVDPEMLEKLKEMLSESRYIDWLDDDLLEKIKCNMTVFTMAMDRIGSAGWDPPSQKELDDLSYFWGDLHSNLKTAIELLNMSDRVLRGFDYDPSEKGRYLMYQSLNSKLEQWKLKKSDHA